MPRKVGKIEQYGLTERVLAMTREGQSSRVISAALKSEGFSLDQATISKFLKKMRELGQPTVAEVVEKHVLETVPQDLDALEEMELQCLSRARELKGDFGHRLARLYVHEDLPRWAGFFARASEALAAARSGDDDQKMAAEDELGEVAEAIIKQAVIYVTNDLALEKARNAARRSAAQIIALKLQYSGIIGGEAAGNIFFQDQEATETTKDAELRKTGTFTIEGPGHG